MRKRQLAAHAEALDADNVRLDLDLQLCRDRVKALEHGIYWFLVAQDTGEMGERDRRIENLRWLMELR